AMLRKLIPPTGVAAEFADDSFNVGYVRLKGRTAVCLLNWDERPQTLAAKLPGTCRVTDHWTGKDLGRHEGTFEVKDIPGHSGPPRGPRRRCPPDRSAAVPRPARLSEPPLNLLARQPACGLRYLSFVCWLE